MNRTDLIDAIAQETEESKAAVGRFLDAFVKHVQGAVANGDEVKLAGFGKFHRAKVAERPGRNPRTGETVTIPETVRPRFTPGEGFKDLVRSTAGR